MRSRLPALVLRRSLGLLPPSWSCLRGSRPPSRGSSPPSGSWRSPSLTCTLPSSRRRPRATSSGLPLRSPSSSWTPCTRSRSRSGRTLRPHRLPRCRACGRLDACPPWPASPWEAGEKVPTLMDGTSACGGCQPAAPGASLTPSTPSSSIPPASSSNREPLISSLSPWASRRAPPTTLGSASR